MGDKVQGFVISGYFVAGALAPLPGLEMLPLKQISSSFVDAAREE